METARPATPADGDILARLWERAVAELDGQRGGALLAGDLYRADLPGFLAASFTDTDRLLVLGYIDHVALGLASVFVNRVRREPVATLELIYTDPSARQVGVAEAMLDVVTDWASTRDVIGVDASALPGNRSAKSFFETQGFQARLLVMYRPRPAGRSADD